MLHQLIHVIFIRVGKKAVLSTENYMGTTAKTENEICLKEHRILMTDKTIESQNRLHRIITCSNGFNTSLLKYSEKDHKQI